MIVFMVIFLVILVIISIKVQTFYKNNIKNNITDDSPINDREETITSSSEEDSIDYDDYTNLESTLVDAAIEFYKTADESTTSVSSDALIENGYLSSTDLLDIKDKTPCTGYVDIEKDDDYNINYYPHLKCANYETEVTND